MRGSGAILPTEMGRLSSATWHVVAGGPERCSLGKAASKDKSYVSQKIVAKKKKKYYVSSRGLIVDVL